MPEQSTLTTLNELVRAKAHNIARDKVDKVLKPLFDFVRAAGINGSRTGFYPNKNERAMEVQYGGLLNKLFTQLMEVAQDIESRKLQQAFFTKLENLNIMALAGSCDQFAALEDRIKTLEQSSPEQTTELIDALKELIDMKVSAGVIAAQNHAANRREVMAKDINNTISQLLNSPTPDEVLREHVKDKHTKKKSRKGKT